MAPSVLQRIFDPFEQADSSTTRLHGGTGLGLAISRRLVSAMGGSLEVDSQEGCGSTFRFEVTLPAASSAAVTALAAAVDLAGSRILAVDDNELNLRVLREQLAGSGALVDTEISALRAEERIQQAASEGRPYAAVVLDQVMPEEDGVALGRRLRARCELEGVALVLLTSLGAGPSEQELAGFDGFLVKPVRPSVLAGLVAAAIGKRRSGGQGTLSRHHLRPAVESGRREIEARFPASRVLLVEDNAFNQRLACKLLEKLGCTVEVAEDGAVALEILLGPEAARQPDVVLMDCQMPHLDGVEATRRIRGSEGAAARLPIIALTAGVLDEDRQRCLAAGMDDFLTKPIRVPALIAMLERWLPAPAAETEPVGQPPPG
jgi:CheY-like chemotaxis protein